MTLHLDSKSNSLFLLLVLLNRTDVVSCDVFCPVQSLILEMLIDSSSLDGSHRVSVCFAVLLQCC